MSTMPATVKLEDTEFEVSSLPPSIQDNLLLLSNAKTRVTDGQEERESLIARINEIDINVALYQAAATTLESTIINQLREYSSSLRVEGVDLSVDNIDEVYEAIISPDSQFDSAVAALTATEDQQIISEIVSEINKDAISDAVSETPAETTKVTKQTKTRAKRTPK